MDWNNYFNPLFSNRFVLQIDGVFYFFVTVVNPITTYDLH